MPRTRRSKAAKGARLIVIVTTCSAAIILLIYLISTYKTIGHKNTAVNHKDVVSTENTATADTATAGLGQASGAVGEATDNGFPTAGHRGRKFGPGFRPTSRSTPSSSCTPPNYSSCGFPDATNTGVPNRIRLTAKSYPRGLVIRTNGTVLDAVHITGYIDVEASNVTIRDSEITGTTWWAIKYGATNRNATNLRILHSTIDSVPGKGPDNGGYDYAISPVNTKGTLEIGYDNISGFKDGIDISNGSVHDTYVHRLSTFRGAHTQCVYVWSGGAGLAITHNTFINQAPSPYPTAAIYIAPDDGRDNNMTLQNNWLAGGAYAVYGGGARATNIRVISNKFSTEIWPHAGIFGPAAYWVPSNFGNLWRGNVWVNGRHRGEPVSP